MDESDFFTSEDIDKFRRTRRPRDVVKTKSLLEKGPRDTDTPKTLFEIGRRIEMEQDKAEKKYLEKLSKIQEQGLKYAKLMKGAKVKKEDGEQVLELKKHEKIMRPSETIGIGRTSAPTSEPMKDKHIHYAKKYGIAFMQEGQRRTYEDLLRAIHKYEMSNLEWIMSQGKDKKTKEYGMFIV